MVDITNIILTLSLLGCLIYIGWLHYNQKPLRNPKIKEEQPDTDDSMAFLRSDYDWSVKQEDNDSFAEQLNEIEKK